MEPDEDDVVLAEDLVQPREVEAVAEAASVATLSPRNVGRVEDHPPVGRDGVPRAERRDAAGPMRSSPNSTSVRGMPRSRHEPLERLAERLGVVRARRSASRPRQTS